MDRIRIRGGKPLHGEIAISGAKNAALPLLAAALLSDKPLRLSNLPNVADVASMVGLLAELGVMVDGDGARRTLWAQNIAHHTAAYDLVRKMRASVLVLGPLLAREARARVSLPGGCAIGTRPIDIHLGALRQLGAEINLTEGYVEASAPGGLQGGHVTFSSVSVGATENLLMAAVLARGETVLANAAREPEIVDLAACLIAMGARIDGAGTDTITVSGVDRLDDAVHAVLPDRIETGTYAVAAAITGGELFLSGARLELMNAVTEVLAGAGVLLEERNDGLLARRADGIVVGSDVVTQPYPGFPTDMQAQMMALMAIADGASLITETIFENRFMHVPELNRMGADITVQGSTAIVRGVAHLIGAPVMATDLRASVSLVLAGLAARDETLVQRVYHLDRGYDHIEAKLAACGADIERVNE
ncbi:MAG: UDP-N-acetylglucosamine 1-carboxyvinyltransferase [Alphaproteobacteria bacterium]|jgi:UDP-N-acetylglucosamine 1-carboxyvinyltransferase|nr:UDP-N-acetylglucosamine 1-carboxyvinyltransferase [Alphaproteobacteria bacterium]MDP7488317.1 UDP-N-acetylglucosamine 1-carboxyvinyltransferase [Alphaproteobacteria bacterium]HJN21421.1 UDP-N-acetylglucosamine 1-carboxyvinyltransferase [Alphaproteobacteria bacterium]|tara:strand:- start:1074 stop:2333 length:1260 start_codon:yes stop_codon:yes gene_type:complete